MKAIASNNHPLDTEIASALIARPLTLRELAAALDRSPNTLRPRIIVLHENGRIHILRWARHNSFDAPVWAYGQGRDAPAPVTHGESEEVLDARRRARAIAQCVPRRDWAVAALFGDAR